MRRFLIQWFRLALIIALTTGGIFYAHTHWMHYERIICDPLHVPEGHVCLKTILEDWNGKVLWVDARSQDAFERAVTRDPQGVPHLGDTPVVAIRNDAYALDLLAEAMPALLDAHAQGRKIVIFCDKSCSSSREVANQLRDPSLGIEAPIYILEGGWDVLRREARYQPQITITPDYIPPRKTGTP